MKNRLVGFFRNFLAAAKSLAEHRPLGGAHRKPFTEITPYVNRIISDAILYNEVPSPTEGEERRVNFITSRLADFGISNVSTDEAGNVRVLISGSKPTDEYVLLFAEIENDDYSPLDSLVRLTADRATGSGIADNSIGVASLLVLAEYLQNQSIRYDTNLVLLFTRLASQDEEFAGLRRFLSDWDGRIAFAVYVTGIQLGNIETNPLGHYKLTVTVNTGEREIMDKSPGASAVSVLSNIAFQLGSIKWDSENNTTLNVARIVAGVGYGFFPSEGFLELEIYSGDTHVLDMAKKAAEATMEKFALETGAKIDVAVNSFIPVGNPEINSFLTESLKKIHGMLKIKSNFVSVPDKTAIINSFGVPAVSIGITRGKKRLAEEYVELASIETGFRQLLLLLEKSIETEELLRP
jgi:tripeptide aminopeptidase